MLVLDLITLLDTKVFRFLASVVDSADTRAMSATDRLRMDSTVFKPPVEVKKVMILNKVVFRAL